MAWRWDFGFQTIKQDAQLSHCANLHRAIVRCALKCLLSVWFRETKPAFLLMNLVRCHRCQQRLFATSLSSRAFLCSNHCHPGGTALASRGVVRRALCSTACEAGVGLLGCPLVHPDCCMIMPFLLLNGITSFAFGFPVAMIQYGPSHCGTVIV